MDVSGVDGGGAPPTGGEDGEVTVAATAAAPSGGVVHDHGGALGLQLLGAQHSLVRHGALDKHRIWTVSCGDGPHAIALTHPSAGGRAIVWGRNSSGELGLGELEQGGTAPRHLMAGALAGRKEPMLYAAAGAHYTLVAGARADDVIGWGESLKGQLGPSATDGSNSGGGGGLAKVMWMPLAMQSVGPAEAQLLSLTAGAQHAGALLTHGGAESGSGGVLWGSGAYGALGRGDVADHAEPAPCNRGSLAGQLLMHLACGRDCTVAVDHVGRLHGWGRMWGKSATPAVTQPKMLAATLGTSSLGDAPLVVRTLCCTGRRVLMLCAPIDAPCDGDDDAARGSAPSAASGQVGSVFACMVGGQPQAIQALKQVNITALHGTADNILALTSGGQCVRVGFNGAAADSMALPDGARAVQVAAARTHCAVLVANAPPALVAPSKRKCSSAAAGSVPPITQLEPPPPSPGARRSLLATAQAGVGGSEPPGSKIETTGDPELDARLRDSLTLGGSRPRTVGSRPGTAGSRPCWLQG